MLATVLTWAPAWPRPISSPVIGPPPRASACARPPPPSATRPRPGGAISSVAGATAIPPPRVAPGSIPPTPRRRPAEPFPSLRAPPRSGGARPAGPLPPGRGHLDLHLRLRRLSLRRRDPGLPAERGRTGARPRRRARSAGSTIVRRVNVPLARVPAPCARGVHRHRGPPLLLPRRRRLARAPARALVRNVASARRPRGLQHHHHAGGAQRLRARSSRSERSLRRKLIELHLAAPARAHAHQAADPRALPQRHLPRQRRLRRRGREPRSLRQERRAASRSPRARRSRRWPEGRRSTRRAASRPRAGAAESRAHPHGPRALSERQRRRAGPGDAAPARAGRVAAAARTARSRSTRCAPSSTPCSATTRLGDLIVYTTLDARAQRAAERRRAAAGGGDPRQRVAGARRHRRDALAGRARRARSAQRRHPRARRRRGATCRGGFNRALVAQRQPGSAFKPFVYAAALAAGHTPAAVIDGRRRSRSPSTGRIWRPANFDGEYAGRLTLRRALMRSANAATVRLGRGRRRAARGGAGPPRRDPEPARRGAGPGARRRRVTPLELVTAYAPFANGGLRVTPSLVRRIEAGDGTRALARAVRAAERVLGAARGVSAHVDAAIGGRRRHRPAGARSRRPRARSPARRARPTTAPTSGSSATRRPSSPPSGSGTTRPARSRPPPPAAASPRRPGRPSISTAGASARRRTGRRPPGMVSRTIDAFNGDLANEWCPVAQREWFRPGTEPTRICREHSAPFIDRLEEFGRKLGKAVKDLLGLYGRAVRRSGGQANAGRQPPISITPADRLTVRPSDRSDLPAAPSPDTPADPSAPAPPRGSPSPDTGGSSACWRSRRSRCSGAARASRCPCA